MSAPASAGSIFPLRRRRDRRRRLAARVTGLSLGVVCALIVNLHGLARTPPARPRPARPGPAYRDFDTDRALATARRLAVTPRPAGSVAERAAAAFLRRRLRDCGYETRVQSGVRLPGGGVTCNVIGVRRHPLQPRRLLIGAHFDSVADCPGANDNASGVAVTLELARLLARASLPCSLEIAFFGGEERGPTSPGLIGSAAHVARCGSGHLPVAMICVDMVGRGSQTVLWHDGNAARLRQSLAASARRLGVPCRFGLRCEGSDFAPFAAAGVPAVWIQRLPDACNHRPHDRLGRLQPDALRETGRLLAHALLSLSAADLGLPAIRENAPQVIATTPDIAAADASVRGRSLTLCWDLGGFHGRIARTPGGRGAPAAADAGVRLRVAAGGHSEPHPCTDR